MSSCSLTMNKSGRGYTERVLVNGTPSLLFERLKKGDLQSIPNQTIQEAVEAKVITNPNNFLEKAMLLYNLALQQKSFGLDKLGEPLLEYKGGQFVPYKAIRSSLNDDRYIDNSLIGNATKVSSEAIKIDEREVKSNNTVSNDFNKELAQKIQTKLEILYPEIKLNITNKPKWEQGKDVLNQTGYIDKVNYSLKATQILLSDKAKQVFAKGNKNKWSLDRILTELQIPKEQKQLILDSGLNNREEIITDLLANYSYTVEVNTTEDKVIEGGYISNLGSKVTSMENRYSKYYYTDERGVEIEINKTDWETAKEIFDGFQKGNNRGVPTQYYSNLTVAGGTNYSEQEISTPAITPSIKGHAQFATDQGIGWFRSDEQLGTFIKPTLPNKFIAGIFGGDEVSYRKIDSKWYRFINNTQTVEVSESEVRTRYDINIDEGKLGTRRILELQSDLFQKGRDKKDLIGGTTGKLNAQQQDEYRIENYLYFIDEGGGYVKNNLLDDNMKTKFQKISKEEFEKNIPDLKTNSNENQFLQLLNKDSNWITFFVKSIIQDSSKKGYEKVLFPSGNTASKVEGHTTLEEFKKQKEDRIKELEKQEPQYAFTTAEASSVFSSKISSKFNDDYNEELRLNTKKYEGKYIVVDRSLGSDGRVYGVNLPQDLKNIEIYNTKEEAEKVSKSKGTRQDTEINQLKQELERVETEGFGALKPIYNFYENTVTNILNKTYGKSNVKVITDEYGNTWNEVTINQVRDLADILLQRNEANQIIGQANIKAGTILIAAFFKATDSQINNMIKEGLIKKECN